MRTIVVITLLLTLCTSAFPREDVMRAQYESCLSSADAAYKPGDACHASERKYQDARLARVLRAARNRVAVGLSRLFEASQTQWEAYRERECKYQQAESDAWRKANPNARAPSSMDCWAMATSFRSWYLETYYGL